MNYQIILDEDILKNFINSLPNLKVNETFYVCLFARSKYIGKKLSGFNNDKAQLKRFTATKETLFYKIKQLEVPIGSYIQHNKATNEIIPCPQEALALYMHINPRSNRKANKRLIKKLVDMLDNENYNVHNEALSAIHKSVGTKYFVDFDFDNLEPNFVIESIKSNNIINIDCLSVLKTRTGFHIMVETSKISNEFKKTNWYVKIQNLGADKKACGDNLIPIPGTHQGGFTPKFHKL